MLPSRTEFAAHHVEVCKQYIGVSRESDQPQVANFLALFGLPYSIGGDPVAFCDAGLSYAGCKALADLTGVTYIGENAVEVFRKLIPVLRDNYFTPAAACHVTRNAAVEAGRWIDANGAGPNVPITPGDLVLYSWVDGTEPDHIEIVIEDGGDTIRTIGFNTSDADNINGGVVAERERTWQHILGFVRMSP